MSSFDFLQSFKKLTTVFSPWAMQIQEFGLWGVLITRTKVKVKLIRLALRVARDFPGLPPAWPSTISSSSSQ